MGNKRKGRPSPALNLPSEQDKNLMRMRAVRSVAEEMGVSCFYRCVAAVCRRFISFSRFCVLFVCLRRLFHVRFGVVHTRSYRWLTSRAMSYYGIYEVQLFVLSCSSSSFILISTC